MNFVTLPKNVAARCGQGFCGNCAERAIRNTLGDATKTNQFSVFGTNEAEGVMAVILCYPGAFGNSMMFTSFVAANDATTSSNVENSLVASMSGCLC